MYFSFIHEIIFIISLTIFYQLVYGDNPSKIILKNHLLPSNEIRKRPLSIIVRMIAIGIRRPDDVENKAELIDTNNEKPLWAYNKGSDDKQTQELQKNNRVLLLPLMIRILLERIGERGDKIQNSHEVKIVKIKPESNTKNLSETIKEFININDDDTKAEKITLIVFLILSFAVFLLTTFL